MPKALKPLPEFASEAEERKFWLTHDTTDYLDWRKAEKVQPLKRVGSEAVNKSAVSRDRK